MILEQITLYHIRMFLQTPFETSFGRSETRDCIVIETKSGGITGYGECVADRDPGYSYETVATAWHILSDFLIPAVIGVDIASPADYQKRVSFVRGHLMAKAGIEMALWDLLGKIRAHSLRSLMGGAREHV